MLKTRLAKCQQPMERWAGWTDMPFLKQLRNDFVARRNLLHDFYTGSFALRKEHAQVCRTGKVWQTSSCGTSRFNLSIHDVLWSCTCGLPRFAPATPSPPALHQPARRRFRSALWRRPSRSRQKATRRSCRRGQVFPLRPQTPSDVDM